jgi:hypothetical protein
MNFRYGGGPVQHPESMNPQPINPLLRLIQQIRMGGGGAPTHGEIHGFGPGGAVSSQPSDPSPFLEEQFRLAGNGLATHPEGTPTSPAQALHLVSGLSPLAGAHSNFLGDLHPDAHAALLKILARLNAHMPVGPDASGRTRPGFHSQSTHNMVVAQRNARNAPVQPYTYGAE